ncbi:hypothetical protein F4861DRAFT_540524 [Xylaria intraflava]|nr:hypothetical protein F4861DRAFT_540524 [Xylaria intraflava]
MQLSAITTAFGMLLASAPAFTNPVKELLQRQVSVIPLPISIFGLDYDAPISTYPIGSLCTGSRYACNPNCPYIESLAKDSLTQLNALTEPMSPLPRARRPLAPVTRPAVRFVPAAPKR